MSIGAALGLLIVLAAGLLIGLEVTRELSDDKQGGQVRFFVVGVLGGVILTALVATVALFRSALS